MVKEKNVDFTTNWYELWMKQSKEFFDALNKSGKDIFGSREIPHPEDYINQIQQWSEMFKKQLQFMQPNGQQKSYETYWKMMSDMYNEAFLKLVDQWMERVRNQKPITNMRELYELWLDCCHEVYEKSMRTNAHQRAYGELMNAALTYWKSVIPQ